MASFVLSERPDNIKIWYLSVESFLGGIEGVISNTNYESNFDDNNGDFSDGTYAQEGRNEQLTFDRATFWNFVDFYWAETYSNDTGWKNYGDLDYWTPQASLVYFISPNEDRILTSVNPTGDARLQAFEPYAINDSHIWYTFKEDLYATLSLSEESATNAALSWAISLVNFSENFTSAKRCCTV